MADLRLGRLIDAWPTLPETTRDAIVALLDAAGPLDAEQSAQGGETNA